MNTINAACVIEDDPLHLFIADKLLKKTGAFENIIVCSNGKDAYDKLKAMFETGKHLPKLILLDLNMPVWDGWQFLDHFTQIPIDQKVSIYILTSSINKEDMERAESYGLRTHYMVKPLNMEMLNKIIMEVE